MAPNPLDTIDETLKSTIHSLFTIQLSTQGYAGPSTHSVLLQQISSLTSSLSALQTLAPPPPAPSAEDPFGNANLSSLLPPEVIEYVDQGRNPDIYTREFVELVQRNNAYLKGKSEAVKGLRDALGEEIAKEWPELSEVVKKVVQGEGHGIEGLQTQVAETGTSGESGTQGINGVVGGF